MIMFNSHKIIITKIMRVIKIKHNKIILKINN